MFIELNNGQLLNLVWLDDLYIDKHDLKRVIYVYVNGSKKEEVFDNEGEATSRLEEIKTKILQK